jgi:hypothetical protein
MGSIVNVALLGVGCSSPDACLSIFLEDSMSDGHVQNTLFLMDPGAGLFDACSYVCYLFI